MYVMRYNVDVLRVLCLYAHMHALSMTCPQEPGVGVVFSGTRIIDSPLEVLFNAEAPLQPSMYVMKERLIWEGGKGPAGGGYGGGQWAEGSGNTDENSSS